MTALTFNRGRLQLIIHAALRDDIPAKENDRNYRLFFAHINRSHWDAHIREIRTLSNAGDYVGSGQRQKELAELKTTCSNGDVCSCGIEAAE